LRDGRAGGEASGRVRGRDVKIGTIIATPPPSTDDILHPTRPQPAGTAMASPSKASVLSDPFKLTMIIFAIIAFMYFAGEVLKPLALSVLLSFAVAPGVRFLENRKVPRPAAVVLTGVLSLGAHAERSRTFRRMAPGWQGRR
ncbi:AI-2E family transporter, partial [Singulisphaera rosea]